MSRPLSVSTVLFDGHPFERGFSLLAGLGITQVEPAFIEGYVAFDEDSFGRAGRSAMAAALRAEGLTARAISAHTDLGRADAVARLGRRLDFAAAVGARTVVTNAATVASRPGCMATLDAALPMAEALGLVIALENPGHGAGAMLADGRAGADLVRQIDHPHLRLNYDIGNAATYAGRERVDLADLHAALAVCDQVHLKDVTAAQADWRYCAIGDGCLGYDSVLAALPADLPVALELPLRLGRPGRGDPVRDSDPASWDRIGAALERSLAFLGRAGR